MRLAPDLMLGSPRAARRCAVTSPFHRLPVRSVLLVHPDAASWILGRTFQDAVTPTESTRSARAYLAGTAFDLILVGPGVEGAEAIGALRDVLGLSTAIEHVADATEAVARLRVEAPAPVAKAPAEEAPSAPSPPASVSGPGPSGAGRAGGLGHVADELSRVAHALNNPLAVIAGNAQLALEMAGALDTDPAIVESLQAIDLAAAELGALFAEVAGLRAVVEREHKARRAS